jgi:hypothetical protein
MVPGSEKPVPRRDEASLTKGSVSMQSRVFLQPFVFKLEHVSDSPGQLFKIQIAGAQAQAF